MLRSLASWFSIVRRPFPWRQNHSPYRVLVSEIMLQQTQASRVIVFFERWMKRFPTIESLALASESQVIKMWEGLGYYSRARALHAIAKRLVDSHQAKIPDNLSDLLALPGIGPYTAGAILSFAFHQRAVAIDANVTRVLMRLLGEQEKKKLPTLLEALLPQEKPWMFIEALIELGALVCRRTPECSKCPLSASCHAFATNTHLCVYSSPKKVTLLFRDVCLFHHDGFYLVTKRCGKRIMSGLFEFPFFESVQDGRTSEDLIEHIHQSCFDTFSDTGMKNAKSSRWECLSNSIECSIIHVMPLPIVTHSFTRYRATLYPKILHVSRCFEFKDSQWVSASGLKALPFSSGHKKIVQTIDIFRNSG